MSSAAEILIVILSIALTFFLILGMVLMVYLIVLTRQIRKITKSAERTVDGLGSTMAGFSKIMSPIFIAEIINKFIKKFKTNQREK
jgi:hypothetical protein